MSSRFIRVFRPVAPPQGAAYLARGNPMLVGLTELAIPSQLRTLVRGTQLSYTSNPTLGLVAGGVGQSWQFPGAGSNDNVIIGTADVIVPSATDFTAFVLRRSKDTTARNSTVFGYNTSSSNRVLANAPYGDGNAYWDFGNSTTGRLSVGAFTKTTEVEALVFIAGGGKGREVWRDGVKIASNANSASRTASSVNFSVGGQTTTSAASDLEEVFLFGTLARAWTDAEVAQWTANPWGVLEGRRKYWFPHVASAASASRPVVFVAT